MGRIGYLGPVGTYSEKAAKVFAHGDEIVPYRGFLNLITALKCGKVDYAVLPISNSLNGGVMQNIDILQYNDGICATALCKLKIDHRLITLKGADKSKIKRIYSHGQALAQCQLYLYKNFPQAEQLETASTAAGVNLICGEEDAGIVGADYFREGYELTDYSISDEKNNYTSFLLVKMGEPDENAYSDLVYFSVTCPHKPGALASLLEVLSRHGINMTKIESRPIKDKMGEYRFFIETEADYSSESTKSFLSEIQKASVSYKLLGCYKKVEAR